VPPHRSERDWVIALEPLRSPAPLQFTSSL